jgi:hypothetical protein
MKSRRVGMSSAVRQTQEAHPRSSDAQVSETPSSQAGERLAAASRSARKSEWVYVDPDDPRMWPITTPEEGNGWAYVHQDLAIDTRARRLRVAFRLHSPTHQLLAWWREFGRAADNEGRQ